MTLSAETLQRFCATPDDPRYYLQTPFRQAGMIYATNGHFFVEIADDGRLLESATQTFLPKVKTIIDRLKPADFVPIPDMLEMIPCETCGGDGMHARVECPVGSEGVPTTCLACDGIGETVVLADLTEVGPAKFASRYLRFLVRMLPGPVTIAVSGPKDPAEFRFAGGRGVLMPVCL